MLERRFVSGRMSIVFLFLLLLLPPQGQAKKRTQLLSDDVLRAETVLVVVHPDASEALTNPMANRTAQADVQSAIMRWGKFKLVFDAQTADLVIAVRKGHKGGPIISHSPADDRTGMPPFGGPIGAQQGRPPTSQIVGGLISRILAWAGPRIEALTSTTRLVHRKIRSKCIGAGWSTRWIPPQSGGT